MIKPRDYDNVNAAEYGAEQLQIQPGGHGCEIFKAETVKDAYGEKLVINFDIREGGEFDNYYSKKFKSGKEKFGEAKWGGVFRQAIYKKDGSTNPYFKGLVTSIEKSNPNFKWNFDEATLKGKKIGFIFREEEFKAQNGEIKTTVRAAWACDYAGAADIPAPNIRKYEEKPLESQGFVETGDSELPF